MIEINVLISVIIHYDNELSNNILAYICRAQYNYAEFAE